MVDGAQRRENFRITYPAAERASLQWNNEKFIILDLAAAGVRFDAGSKVAEFQAKTNEMKFTVLLLCGKKVDIAGKFLRAKDSEVVITLTMEIPVTLINQEQIYLRSKYAY